MISGDYRQPVQVNGFTCRNCTDVDYAKKHIDPRHPKSGPYDVDAASDPTRAGRPSSAVQPRALASAGLGVALDILV